MRDHVHLRSLNDQVRDEGGNLVELAETIDQEDRLRRIGRQPRCQRELSELAMDVEHVLARLPSRLRKLCEWLEVGTVSEVSRQTGIPEAALHEDIKALRARFEEAGLAQYLAQAS